MDICIVTCSDHDTLLQDDLLLQESLLQEGLATRIVPWDDPLMKWSDSGLCIIRSTWDYHLKPHRFLEWARHVSTVSRLLNPLPVIVWNTHKGSYLKHLENCGVPCVPVLCIGHGSAVDLSEVLRQKGWEKAVIKPAISLGAKDTFQVSEATGLYHEWWSKKILAQGDMLIQPFYSSVKSQGEVSMIFLGGHFSHAVRKFPPPSDFRVQEKFGGWYEMFQPDSRKLALAAKALEVPPGGALYARIDLLEDDDGLDRVIELELVEPDLFLRVSHRSVKQFKLAITAFLESVQKQCRPSGKPSPQDAPPMP